MNASVRSSTFPSRSMAMIVGIVSPANCWQKGHCRSTHSTSVTGAEGEPSTLPVCGIPVAPPRRREARS